MMTDDRDYPLCWEIWLVDYTYDYNNNSEDDFNFENSIKKLRPSLIISNNSQNKNTSDIIVCPITSKEINEEKSFEMLLKPNDVNNLSKDSKVLLNLIFTIDKDVRLKKFIGKLSKEEINVFENKVKLVLNLN